jgi:hypothetical protein
VAPGKKEYVQLSLPFGPKARLVIMHLNTEAIRSASPVVEVERSLTAFARRLLQGNDPNGREVRAIKEQLAALSSATIRLAVDAGDAATQVNTQIVGALQLWPDEDARQRVLWPATVRLSADYFREPLAARRAAGRTGGGGLGAFRDGPGRLRVVGAAATPHTPRPPPVRALGGAARAVRAGFRQDQGFPRTLPGRAAAGFLPVS